MHKIFNTHNIFSKNKIQLQVMQRKIFLTSSHKEKAMLNSADFKEN